MLKKLVLFAVIFSISTLILIGCGNESPPQDSSLSTEAPTTEAVEETEATSEEEENPPYYMEDLKLTKLDGEETSLYAYEGKIIILNFWATWCKFCIEEMPLFDEVNKRDDLVVLAVSTGEDEETVQAYIDEYGYAFDVFLDENAALSSSFGVTGLPTSFFIAPDMELLYVQPGMVDAPTLDRIIEAMEEIIENQ